MIATAAGGRSLREEGYGEEAGIAGRIPRGDDRADGDRELARRRGARVRAIKSRGLERVDDHGRGVSVLRVDRGAGDDVVVGEAAGRGSFARAIISAGAAAGGDPVRAGAGVVRLSEIRLTDAAAAGGVAADRDLFCDCGGDLLNDVGAG